MHPQLALLVAALLVLPPSLTLSQTHPAQPGSTTPVRLSTPRIPPLAESQWTDQHRALVAEYAPDGRVGNGLATLLHVPELVEAIGPFVRFLARESSLEPRHRALLLLRTAWVTQNQYLWARFAAEGPGSRTDGPRNSVRLPADQPRTGRASTRSRCLRLADELYRNSSVTDATWTTLGIRYNLTQMVEAVMNVNEFTLLSMMFNAMGVQPRRGGDGETAGRYPLPHLRPRPGTAAASSADRTTRRRLNPGRSDVSGDIHASPRHAAVSRVSSTGSLRSHPHNRELLIAYRLELPGGLRVGETCRQRRSRSRPRLGPAQCGGRARCARMGAVSCDLVERRRRAVSRCDGFGRDLGGANRGVRHAGTDQRTYDGQQLPTRVDVTERLRGAAARYR